MKNSANAVVLTLAILGIVATSSGQACASSVLFDTTGVGNTNYFYQIADNGAAASFSSVATTTRLTEVDLDLGIITDLTPSGTITISLFATGTNPFAGGPVAGTFLAGVGTIAESSLTSISTNYAFVLPTSYVLSANTQYWIGLSSTGTGAGWGFTNVVGTGTSGQSFTAGGGSELDYGGANNGTFQMKVTSTAVPEPTSLALLFVGSVSALAAHGVRARRISIA